MADNEIVHVRWFDASYQRGECELEDLVTRVELEDVGFLVREDSESISIALSRYVNDETWRYIEHIPKVNVIEITWLVPAASVPPAAPTPEAPRPDQARTE